MLSCSCSVRALELFIKDFAGIRIRQYRPQFQFHQQRRFGTRPPFRQVASVGSVSDSVEDGFVPFDANTTGNQDAIAERGSDIERGVKNLTPVELDEEWHAKVAITSQGSRETGTSLKLDTAANSGLKNGAGEAEAHDEDVATDGGDGGVAIQDLHSPLFQGTEEMPTRKPKSDPRESQVKAQRRKERKQRRLQSGEFGKYKKASEERGEQEYSDGRIQGVLKKTEALDGPGVGEKVSTKEVAPKGKKAESKAQEKQERRKKPRHWVNDRRTREKAREERVAARKAENGESPLKPWQLKRENKLRRKQEREQKVVSAPAGAAKARVAAQGGKPDKGVKGKESRIESKQASNKPIQPERPKPKKESWQVQKEALKQKFGPQGWQPRKRLSPDTLEGIRALHNSDPGSYSTKTLSEHFQVTPEAIRRILKSKWRPNAEEVEKRKERWEKRGVRKWTEMAEQGVRPPAKWRAKGIRHTPPPGEGKKKARWRDRDQSVPWVDESEGGGGGSLAGRIL